MRIIKTILSLLRVKTITLVEKKYEGSNIYTFIFNCDEDITWNPGQHGIFKISHKKINRPRRAFSIASLSEDNKIIISTRIDENPSEFKEALSELEVGMSMEMRGPVGGLYKESNKMKIMVATGIGITPYRAIIKSLKKNSDMNFKMLYLSKKDNFIYQDIINCEKNENIQCFTERNNMISTLDNLVKIYSNKANYYIVGAPKVTNSISKRLREVGVYKRNINKDKFLGY